MKPVDFQESNFVYKGSTAEVGDLHVLRTESAAYSRWLLSAEDVRDILTSGHIWIRVLGQEHPAISIMAEEPAEVAMERAARMLPNDTRMRIDTAS